MSKLYFYVHTHWDREWYQPFESFRTQLVHLVKQVVGNLESGSLPRFYMDGQSVIFDDVLEIEPDLEPRLRTAMQEGKLSAGPWYVLADQALVSGESLVRNLQFGLKGLRKFGDPALVGYCPDTFGHSADLPRILRGFGIETAAVWRGVPALDKAPVFWWYSPDGSKVLTYHLTHGYYQTAFHETSGAMRSAAGRSAVENLAGSLRSWVDPAPGNNGGARSLYEDIDGALLPIGADHTAPPEDLNALIDETNDALRSAKSDVELVGTTLSEFMRDVRSCAEKPMAVVQKVTGELRYNQSASRYARAYLLPGVLSTRLNLKRANRLAEYKLTRMAEPISSVVRALSVASYPAHELEHAWKLVLKNHPHDSICGCSVDAVHREMAVRTERFHSTVDSLFDAVSSAVAGPSTDGLLSAQDPDFGCNRLVVFNATGHSVAAPLYLRWAISPSKAKELETTENVQIVSRKRCDHLFSGWGSVPYYKEVEVVEGWVWPDRVPSLGTRTIAWPDALDVVEAFDAAEPTNNGHHSPDETSTNGASEEVVVAQVADKTAPVLPHVEPCKPVSVRSNRMSNGVLEVSVASDGDLKVTHNVDGDLPRVYSLRHRIRDVGDGGDSYNFDPVPEDKAIRARAVSVKAGQRGPLNGSIVITYELEIPECAESVGPLRLKGDDEAHKILVLKRSKARNKHRIVTEISLRRGVPIVFFETQWNNQSHDHRLEVVFDTGKKVRETHAENHFSIVAREHDVRGGRSQSLPVPIAHEAPADRFPCQRFFMANNQVFFNTGMPEYGVDDEQVTMTMLRAVSWLSKPRLWTRGGGAGPNIEVPEANGCGPNICTYGWAPLAVASRRADGGSTLTIDGYPQAYQLAEVYEGALWATPARSSRWQTKTTSLVSIDNPAIRLVSCSMQSDAPDTVIVRFLNSTPHPQPCLLSFDGNCISGNIVVADLGGAESRNVDARKAGDRHQLPLTFERCELITLHCSLTAGKTPEPAKPAGAETKTTGSRSKVTAAAGTTGGKKKSGKPPGRRKS